jgi:hypothetical protein
MRLALFFLAAAVLCGCRSYEAGGLADGRHEADYARVFREPLPPDVTVLNSRVVSFRPGAASADDFEFELLAPGAWIAKTGKAFYLRKGEGEYLKQEMNLRRSPARPWYAPKALDEYDLYRDLVNVRTVHMLVQKSAEPDGRQRVFISKH